MASKPPEGMKLPTEVVRDGRTYTAEANRRSHADTAFCGTVASRLLDKWLECHDGELPSDPETRKELFDDCFFFADEWRKKLSEFETEKLNHYEDEIQARTKDSGIVLPNAAQVAQYFPPGSIPNI